MCAGIIESIEYIISASVNVTEFYNINKPSLSYNPNINLKQAISNPTLPQTSNSLISFSNN